MIFDPQSYLQQYGAQYGAQQGQSPYTGLGGALRGLLGNRDLALALLANSGGPVKQSFGQIVGQSALQADAMKQQRAEDALKAQYMQAQIGALQREKTTNPYGAYQPGDYTPKSWAEFLKGGDPAVLERYATPRQEFSPSYRSVSRTLPDGSTQQGQFDQRTGEYSWTGAIVPPGQKSRVEAQGQAEGEAAGGQSAKAPAMASFQAATANMRQSIGNTSQGMVGGPLGSVFDYGDKRLFQSRVQQLSTELRTVFRIPGEGTLSDQEQRQYGLQLPDTSNPPDVNEQIIKDIEQRVALRQQTPIGNASVTQPAAQPSQMPTMPPVPGAQRNQAPPAAIEYLRTHPEAAQQFKAKYGYLP